jgi:hypothetical protein
LIFTTQERNNIMYGKKPVGKSGKGSCGEKGGKGRMGGK